MVLLIPKRIKKLKDEGRREGLNEGRKEGFARGIAQGMERGRQEERERLSKAVARFARGEIDIDELRRLTSAQD